MNLTLKNLTGSAISYLSGAVIVPSNSSFVVTTEAQQFDICQDSTVKRDLVFGTINLFDGVSDYTSSSALEYLTKVLNNLNSTPSFDGTYVLPIIINSTILTNGTIFWSMRNNTIGKRMFIQKIWLVASFGGATNSNTSNKWAFARFSAATPSSGTSLVVVKNDNNFPSSNLLDARRNDAGLISTGTVIENDFWPFSNCSQISAQFTLERDDDFILNPGEGLVLKANALLISGVSLNGFVQWSERA